MIEEKTEDIDKYPPRLGGGPLGLGDPDDRRLRKTERDVVIPKLMREEAKKRCVETLKVFIDCTKTAGVLFPLKCQEENNANNDCMISWFQNSQFQEEITNKYLDARSHYRRTGKPLEKYERIKSSGSSMC